ncbi:MAG: response regulator [Bacteroidia bacterium]|nr:response regulator [Bacteroidia bacterium]
MKRAVIVDDELKSIEVLKAITENFIDNIEICGTASDIKGGIRIINETKPDIAFLDIALKEGDSFQILRQIDNINFDVIFITAYDEYTVKALKYSGINVLYKPIDIEEFEKTILKLSGNSKKTGQAIEIASHLLQSKFTKIPITTNKGLTFVSPSQIDYIVNKERGCCIHFNDYTLLETDKSFVDLTNVLEDSNFKIATENHYINFENIELSKTKRGKLIFKSGTELKLDSDEINRILKSMT